MRDTGPHTTPRESGDPSLSRVASLATVSFVIVALATVLLVALALGSGGAIAAVDGDVTAATDHTVAVENGSTYTVGQALSFAVDPDRNGEGFQVRENDSFVAVFEAADGEVVVEDTAALGPGEYTLEHGNTGEVVYEFALEPAPETPTATPTPTPTPEPGSEPGRYEHRLVWPDDIPRDERRNAETTTGGLHWIGDTLRIEVGDNAFVEVRDDGEVIRTLVNDDDDVAYLPTSDMPTGTFTVAHENDEWSFRLGLQLQQFDVTVDDGGGESDGSGGDGTDGERGTSAVVLDSSRPDYAVTLTSDAASNATVANAFANATATETDEGRVVARVDGAGRDTRLPYDPDALPNRTHTLTVAVTDAPVSRTVAIEGTGSVESTPVPRATEAKSTEGGGSNDGDGTDSDGEPGATDGTGDGGGGGAAPMADGGSSVPGFGPIAALVALLAAAALARRR